MRTRRRTGSKSEFARTVCEHLSGKGATPDVYNYVPKRAVTIDEARKHGWPHFWDQITPCSMGHIAARYVTNPAMCVDCNRIASGKPPIYPRTDGSDLTTDSVPDHISPVADDEFIWTPAKRKQFLTAWINTAGVPQALKIIGAQKSHLLKLLADDPVFKAEYERTRDTDVAQSQLWEVEGLAMGGSDRAALQMGATKFPDSFGQRAKSDIGQRQVRTPEQIDAAFTRLVQRLIGPAHAENENGAEPPSATPAISSPGPENAHAGASGVASADGRVGVLVEDDPNSDLVSG